MKKPARRVTKEVPAAQLDRIEKLLIGNGREGMVATVARIEERLNDAAGICDQNAIQLNQLTTDLRILTNSVNGHHKQVHLAQLLASPKFWGYLLLGYAAVHMVLVIAAPWIFALIKAWTGISIPVETIP